MTDAKRTKIVCILPRLGTRVGGGKINAIFKRMNLLVDRPDADVALLTVQHGVNQRRAFAQLVQNSVLDPRIAHASLYEFCTPSGFVGPEPQHTVLPPWDQQIAKGGRKARVTYFDGDAPVMRDMVEETPAGPLLVRSILTDPDTQVRLKYLGDDLIESVRRYGEGLAQKTLYAHGEVVCDMHLAHNAFRKAHCAITGTTYWSEIALQKALVENAFPDNCIVFIDGITTAYLSSHIDARKVLFLHADHRDATGEVVPRSRYLIEAFKGDAIVTATHAHKARLQDDLAASAPIRVIPHYIDAAPRPPRQRRHISTVSRLDLDGKPIHHAIEAFTRVMHRLPGCDYLIYGTGIGEARLKQLIRHHGCEDRIHLMGHTADAAEVFSGALMSIAPTMTEGFGLSLLESLAQGCPVISYDVDYGPRELITPGQNGELVQPSDISALAQAILKVFAQHDAYSAACVSSTAPYTLEAHRRAYSQLIDDLMDEARFFDICAADMTSEVKRALGQTPAQHRGQLVDLLISLCVQRRDLEGLYAAFLQKHALAPRAERPLMRCIWLSRKLGRPDACAAHLHKLADRFPKSYRRLIERHPDVLAFAENG